jgi:molybdopterin synthase sulfur carrier subunit
VADAAGDVNDGSQSNRRVITIELPRALGSYVDGKTEVVLDEPGATVGDALAAFGRRYPGALDRLMNERGEVRQHVNVFVNEQNIRFMDGLRTPVPDMSKIFVLAAISGG